VKKVQAFARITTAYSLILFASAVDLGLYNPYLPASHNMVAVLPGETAISAKRAQLSGKHGFKGLLSNKKTTGIGLFASLGGLVYGCKWEAL
jgi:hypothetical protein